MQRSDAPQLLVDLDAIQRNFATVTSIVGSEVEVSAVIKSDAYGLGIDRLVEPLSAAGCRRFFVATLTEAMRVRDRHKTSDVFILEGMRPAVAEYYRQNGFIPVCNTLAEVEVAASLPCDYALNLETGFSRFGLTFPELRSLIHRKLPPPVLVMSHLACADDPASPLNQLQKNRFIQMAELAGDTPLSLAASAGISLGSDYHFDLVRIGSALYGLNNAGLDPNPFANVVSLRARLADIRLVHAGETVGYMGTFRAPRPSWLGIVAIGYSHGLAWSASNRLCAEIGSHLAPLVGRVAMEYAAVDLTDVPAGLRKTGLWVDLISARRPAEQMARSAATVPQEILLRIGASCRRRYLEKRAPVPA